MIKAPKWLPLAREKFNFEHINCAKLCCIFYCSSIHFIIQIYFDFNFRFPVERQSQQDLKYFLYFPDVNGLKKS